MPVRTIGAVSASVIAFPLLASPAQATTYPYPKPSRTLPAALDVAAFYQEGTRCLTENQPGAVAFAKLLNATYGTHTYGILRKCAAEHGEGRALDWMIDSTKPDQPGPRQRADPLAGRPRRAGPPRRDGPPVRHQLHHLQPPPVEGLGARARLGPLLRRLAAHRPHPLLVQLGRRLQAHLLVERCRGDQAADRPDRSTTTPPPAPAPAPPSRRAATRCSSRVRPAPTSCSPRRSSASPPTASSGRSRQPRSAPGSPSTAYRRRRSSTTRPGRPWSTSSSSRPAPPLSPYVNVVLRRGSTGTAVKALQKAIGKLTVDGSFGPATEARVKEYQKSKGLPSPASSTARSGPP